MPKTCFSLQDRLTVQEREREEAKQRQAEREAQQAAELRRRETLRMVEEAVKKETTERKAKDNDPAGQCCCNGINGQIHNDTYSESTNNHE